MIYLDHAATTPIDSQVLEKMMPYFQKQYGNPSSIYTLGQEAKNAINAAREIIAGILACYPEEIIFTGSGTESNNLAIQGIAEAYRDKYKHCHLIVSNIEHHSVLYTVQKLEKQGFEITYLPVDKYGLIYAEQIKQALQENTVLVSIMYANNEIGTIQPIQEIAAICHERNIIFHTDACQAAGMLPITLRDLNCDLLTLNAGKIYGPKGVGLLYVRQGVEIMPQLLGGSQENKRRAGTENVAGIIGLAEALKIAHEHREENICKMGELRDTLLENLKRNLPEIHLNGHPRCRLPNNINISIPGIEGESFILRLNMEGVAASTGAACTTGSTEPSHVLSAIGLGNDLIYGSLRLTMGKNNTHDEIQEALRIITKVVRDLQGISTIVHL